MVRAPKNHFAARVALLVTLCFCALSMAQVARPLASIERPSVPAIAAAHHGLTRHTHQEVSSRGGHLRAPDAIGLLPIVWVSDHGRLPRMTAYVPLWTIENWPVHRRICPDSADAPAHPA
jgi:hypothetical protein